MQIAGCALSYKNDIIRKPIEFSVSKLLSQITIRYFALLQLSIGKVIQGLEYQHEIFPHPLLPLSIQNIAT